MADGNVEESGVRLTVEDAQKFLETYRKANEAVESFADVATKAAKRLDDLGRADGLDKQADKAKKAKASFADLLNKAGDLPLIGSAAGQAAGMVDGLGAAGASAGALMTAGLGPVAIALAAVTAGAFAAVAALKTGVDVARDFINTAVGWRDVVDEIQDVSGATAQESSFVAALGRRYEVSGGQISAIMTRLATRQQESADAAEEYGAKAGAAYAKVGKQLARLEDDYTRGVTEAQATATARLADLAKQADKLAAKYYADMAARQEEFNRDQAEAAYKLQQQLEDMQREHVERIADLNQDLADLDDDIASSREDRQAKLQDDLADAEGKYQDKRAAIEAKYWAPKGAREEQAKKEELAALDAQYAAEKAALEARAKLEDERANKEFEKKRQRLIKAIEKENAEYARQTERLKAEEDRRAKLAQERFDKETRTAQAAYDEQVTANTEAQDKIKAETEKRIEDLTRAYQRQIEDIREQSEVGGGAFGSAAKKGDEFDKVLEKLGIDAKEFNLKPAYEQFMTILEALGNMEDGTEKTALAAAIAGPRYAGALIDMANEVANKGTGPLMTEFEKLGIILTDKQKENLDKYKTNLADAEMAIDGFKTLIGSELVAAFNDHLFPKLKEFWNEHGPQITTLIGKLVSELLPKLLELFGLIVDALDDTVTQVERDPFGKLAEAAMNVLLPNGPLKDLLNTLLSIFRIVERINGTTIDPQISMQDLGIITQFSNDYYQTSPWTSFTGYADGGVARAFQPAWVGEHGRELIWPMADMAVMPNASASQIYNQYTRSVTSTTNNNTPVNLNIYANTYEGGQRAARGAIDVLHSAGVPITT